MPRQICLWQGRYIDYQGSKSKTTEKKAMATPNTKFLTIVPTMATSMQPIMITMSMPRVGGLFRFNFPIYLYMPDLLYILFLFRDLIHYGSC